MLPLYRYTWRIHLIVLECEYCSIISITASDCFVRVLPTVIRLLSVCIVRAAVVEGYVLY